MYKLVFYVPDTHLQVVKTAVFQAGAGTLGNYDQCCWQVLGCGQFRPLSGSNPHVGENNQIQLVDEYRVEMLCGKNKIREVVKALKSSHPYETPAFDVTEIKVEFNVY